jgi:hypothetical protein
MKRKPKSRTSNTDLFASRGFSSDSLQSRVEDLVGLKVFQNIAKPTQDAHNAMCLRFSEYLAVLNNLNYKAEEVLSHGAPHLPLSMCFLFLFTTLYIVI